MTKDLIKKVVVYSSIAYGITWTIAFGIYWLFRKETINERQLNFYHSFAATGPTIAAFITTYLFYGKQGIRKLLSKLKFQIPNKQTMLLTLSPILFFIIGLLIFRLIKSDYYNFELFARLNWSEIYPFIIWLFPLLTYSIFEEIGWRGFLLPHLQTQSSAWISTVILTVIWGLWHLPFFFYRFDFSVGIAIGFFFGIFVGAIILTSIYNSSRGFIIPVMVFHFLNNFSSMFEKEIIVAVLSTGFVFVAIYIYKTLGKDNFSKIKRTKNYFTNIN
ncbi:MAG: CPBP family intramembrane metalloprotease [Bacteroidales bacterium]|nr:CPBP family intramembrane metalloprotease [Bacteroidales bacterium]